MKAVALNYSTRRLEERDIAEPQIVDPRRRAPSDPGSRYLRNRPGSRSLPPRIPAGGDDYLVLGHECVAEVVRTGSAVTAVTHGRHRRPYRPASLLPPCNWCANGRRDLCSTGQYKERGIVGAHGYFTELAVDRASGSRSHPRKPEASTPS